MAEIPAHIPVLPRKHLSSTTETPFRVRVACGTTRIPFNIKGTGGAGFSEG
jgi:hypothetical protein